MPNTLCYINNRFREYTEASIHISDLGLQRGFAIFDYFMEINGRIPFLEDYLDRFYASAEKIGMTIPLTRDLLKEKIQYLLDQNNLKTSGIKLLLTGGYSEDLYFPSTPNLAILNLPVANQPGDFGEGIKLILLDYQRHMPEVKTTFYLPSIALLHKLKEKGPKEVLFHHNGLITETTRANIFLVKKGVLVTPVEGILKGITRKHVLKAAREIMPVEERNVLLEELWESDEVFITGTSKHVAPVVEVEGRMIGDGVPGKTTQNISGEFENYFSQMFQI